MSRSALRLLPLCALVAALSARAESPLAIGTVQGAGDRSPMTDLRVTVRGRIVAIRDGSLPGAFLQDAGDGNPATSDAIFVESAAFPTDSMRVGNTFEVQGAVAELEAGTGTLTALVAATATPLDPASHRLAAVRLSAPPADWERYEGMRVRIDAPLQVAGTQRFVRNGELVAAFGRDRLRTPVDAFAPGPQAQALAADNARRLLVLDDGSDAENPANVWYLATNELPRTGSELRGVEGVIDPRPGGVRLILTAKPRLQRVPEPKAPKVGGDLRIAGMNLENYFNGDGHGGGFPTPRGARTPDELKTQLARMTATIRGLDPDVLAVMELENDDVGPDSAVAMLVGELNRQAGAAGDWRFVDPGTGSGGDLIRVGLLYRAHRVSPVGAPASLKDDLFGSRSRPPLAQSFRAGDGPVFTVVANHFKSKGCGSGANAAAGADADRHDGQGCWNAVRTESARRLAAWLATDPTHSGSDLTMIVGDLNAYRMEDPVRLLVDAGWQDAFAGHRALPYSYVYDNQIGRLDHALQSPALAARLRGAAEWHSNADEPESRGYQEAPTVLAPWRSSDHDPLVVGFRLRTP